MSLVAGHLEDAGIPTLVMGSARDVVEEVGVARFFFTDFPLGNPVGRAGDPGAQLDNLRDALGLFDSARLPRTTVQSPLVWGEDGWRERFMAVD